MNSLTVKHRKMLLKVAPLLASDKSGEVVAAAAALQRVLEQAGLTWAQIIVDPADTHREPLRGRWRGVCAELQAKPGSLRPWERTFVADLPRFKRISTKQRYVLNEIASRVLHGGAA
jgi:hypothetical protein